MSIAWYICRKRLAILWFATGSLIFLFLLFQTILGKYEEQATEAWSWFLPLIIPTLSLIIGVLVTDIVQNKSNEKNIDRFYFYMAFTISSVYLAAILITLLISPFSAISCLELLKQSNIYLIPFQGLVTASLGAFFVQKGKE